jgi:cell division transport system permease protein
MVRALRYAFDEAVASLWRGRDSGILSTATIAVALFVLGGFLMVTSNLERLGADWASTAELSVYLKDDVTLMEQRAIESAVTGSDVVQSHDYVSKAEALVRFRQTFGDLAAGIDNPDDNPLPASIEVHLRSGPGADAKVDNLAAKLRQLPGTADVRYDRQWLARLQAAINVIRGVGLVLGIVLTIAAALTVANVVRLALHARHDELDIMRLVGAPSAYVRGPFVMEGVLQGGIGAAAALVILAIAFVALRARYLAPLASAVNLSSIQFLPLELVALLVLGGMAVGCLGGLVATWNR